jgi:hypothetical protein
MLDKGAIVYGCVCVSYRLLCPADCRLSSVAYWNLMQIVIYYVSIDVLHGSPDNTNI